MMMQRRSPKLFSRTTARLCTTHLLTQVSKANAYAFQQLADRAYGKIKEKVELEVSEYREMSDEALIERLQQLEKQLGITRQIEGTNVRRLPE
jgi:hypothetical protein